MSSRFSWAVRLSSSAANWPVSDITLRTLSASRTTSYPQTLAVPLVGSHRVASMRTIVVLPAPLGPSRDNDRAVLYLKVEIGDGDEVAEVLGEAFGDNDRFVGGGLVIGHATSI